MGDAEKNPNFLGLRSGNHWGKRPYPKANAPELMRWWAVKERNCPCAAVLGQTKWQHNYQKQVGCIPFSHWHRTQTLKVQLR